MPIPGGPCLPSPRHGEVHGQALCAVRPLEERTYHNAPRPTKQTLTPRARGSRVGTTRQWRVQAALAAEGRQLRGYQRFLRSFDTVAETRLRTPGSRRRPRAAAGRWRQLSLRALPLPLPLLPPLQRGGWCAKNNNKGALRWLRCKAGVNALCETGQGRNKCKQVKAGQGGGQRRCKCEPYGIRPGDQRL